MNERITVVMPVHNSERFLADAINSILNQTYRDFVFFIIDDGSTDSSPEIIRESASRDPRIRIFTQPNAGLIQTLNTYYRIVETPLIARMDSDDVVDTDRLEKQVRFLDEHSDVDVVGTAIRYMNLDMSQVLQTSHFPEQHNVILWKMLYTTGVGHATLLMRKEVFARIGDFSEHALHVEDYDFFLRAKETTRFANLPDILYSYRKNDQSVSHRFQEDQGQKHFELSRKYIETILGSPPPDDLVVFLKRHTLSNPNKASQIYSILNRLYQKFMATHVLQPNERKAIHEDYIRSLSILALTTRNYSFFRGWYLYFRTFIISPWVLLYNLKTRNK